MNLTSTLLKSLLLLCLITFTANSQTTYVWNGSVNSSFSTAGNWTPFRQVGLVTDILVFDHTGSIAINNVNQVTIGQLILRNNSNVTLSPSAGNTKCITIKGGEGEDLLIESGSSLKISCSDPALNMYLNTGATASISGNFIFTGSIAQNINAADAEAIRFKNGSAFYQYCPGNIFNTTGVNNAVVFEAGSSFKVDNGSALSPFGVSASGSKVLFQPHSSFYITRMSVLSLSGRQIPDLIIEQGTTLNITESFTSDITVSNLDIKNGANLNFTNTNAGFTPSINIKGNLSVAGSLGFNPADGKFKIKFNGNVTQEISGNGIINFPSSLEYVLISSHLSVLRDIEFGCIVIGTEGGSISRNGNTINFAPGFPEPFAFNSKNFSASAFDSEQTENNGISPKSTGTTGVPSEFSLSQNYPNPFNPSTKITFSLPVDSKASLKVYDISGKLVVILAEGSLSAGNHTVSMDAAGLSSGVYFYTLSTPMFTKTMKMILAK
jgi:hypothetical protein